MLVGPAGSGKSAICECLAAALTELGTKHVIWRMNPKAITAPQMFGRMDAATGAVCLIADEHAARHSSLAHCPADCQPLVNMFCHWSQACTG